MCIGKKNLASILHTGPVQKVMHSFFIELFKNIIQQEDGGKSFETLKY